MQLNMFSGMATGAVMVLMLVVCVGAITFAIKTFRSNFWFAIIGVSFSIFAGYLFYTPLAYPLPGEIWWHALVGAGLMLSLVLVSVLGLLKHGRDSAASTTTRE